MFDQIFDDGKIIDHKKITSHCTKFTTTASACKAFIWWPFDWKISMIISIIDWKIIWWRWLEYTENIIEETRSEWLYASTVQCTQSRSWQYGCSDNLGHLECLSWQSRQSGAWEVIISDNFEAILNHLGDVCNGEPSRAEWKWVEVIKRCKNGWIPLLHIEIQTTELLMELTN